MEAFIRTSPAASIAAQLMGTEVVRLYHDHVLVKEPGTRQRTPWHQDLPYYNVDGRLNASMWFPVDPVTRAATLEFVAGSHLGPWYMPRSFLDGQARWFPDGRWRSCRTSTPTRSDRVIGWELEPGDAVFFHMLTLHAAGGVEGPGRRRALSVRFLGDDMVHAPRSWATSPPFPGLEQELAPGPTRSSAVPVLWPVAQRTRSRPRGHRSARRPSSPTTAGRAPRCGPGSSPPRRSGDPARSTPRRRPAPPRVQATKFHHMKIGDRNGTPPTTSARAGSRLDDELIPARRSGSRAGRAR